MTDTTYPLPARPAGLSQGNRLAARARDLGAVGEELRPTPWAGYRRKDAAHQFQRAHTLDEAIWLDSFGRQRTSSSSALPTRSVSAS